MKSNLSGKTTVRRQSRTHEKSQRLNSAFANLTNDRNRVAPLADATTTDPAIILAQESIDRWLADTSRAADTPEVDIDLDRLAAALEVLGNLNVGPLADTGPRSNAPLTLGRFQVLCERGRGGFGIVLRAFDTLLQREVALKLPHPERLIAGQSADEFVREAQVAARLQHPGIVRVYEARRLGPVWYIASAYCDGPTLAQWLENRHEPLPPKIAAKLLAAVADAVHYAHSRGVLHLDLKPENILLDEADADGVPHPMVTDFGLAGRVDGAGASMKPRIAGTLGYMAPEQLAGETGRIGVSADIYALGSILRALLQRPDNALKSVSLASAAVSASTASRPHLPAVPRDLASVCEKCLAADPAQRYVTAHDVADDLRRYIRGECVEARPVAWPGRLLRWYRRRPAIAALLTLLATTLVVSMVIITGLWRRAEGDLARFRAEKKLRAQVSDRMQETLLNFAWLTQEGGLQSMGGYVKETSAIETLQSFLRDVRQWTTSDGVREPLDESLLAAMHSLALVRGVEPNDATALEQEFRKGLAAWAAVIKLQPERPQWRRAMALHILTYFTSRPEPKWLAWKGPEYALDREIIDQVEEPYAILLIELAHAQLHNRLVDPSYEMLKAAASLLESRAGRPDEKWTRSRSLLIAYSQLARATELMSQSDESLVYVEKASRLTADAPSPEQCDPLLADAVAESLHFQARTLSHQYKMNEPLHLLESAITYRNRVLKDAPEDAQLRLELVTLHRARAHTFLRKSDNVEAGNAFDRAIAVIDAGMGNAPDHRHLLLHRALISATQGQVWLAADNPERAEAALESAVRDFGKVRLSKRDGRASWLSCIECLQSLGKLYEDQHRFNESLAAYENSLARLAELKPRMPNHPHHAEYTKLSEKGMALVRAKLKASGQLGE